MAKCNGEFRTAEDYRDHLPCLVCEPNGPPKHVYVPTKKDEDAAMLAQACDAIERTTPRMRQATLNFLIDKFITHAPTAGPGSSPPTPIVDPLAATTEVQVRSLLKEMCCVQGCKNKATKRWLISRSAHESARYAPYCDKHGKQHGIEE